MPVVERIDWMIQQLHMGRKAHLSIGDAQDDAKVKLKFRLAAPTDGAVSGTVAHYLVATLLQLRQVVHQHHAVDRGHRHSDGSATICFWLSAPLPQCHGGSPAAQVQPAVGSEPDVAFASRICDPSSSAGATGSDEDVDLIPAPLDPQVQSFDAITLVGIWQALPKAHWNTIYTKFPGFRERNGSSLLREARAEWDLRPQALPTGTRVYISLGYMSIFLGQKAGQILHLGHGQFADSYRVKFDGESGSQWVEMWQCSRRPSIV
jgi:hypothetical protein